jgi:hypothetical protein
MLAAVLALPAFVIAQSKTSIDWKNYEDVAVWKEARDSGKPLLVEAWDDWCRSCRRMDFNVWSDPRVVALSNKFVCVSLKIGPHGLTSDQELTFGPHGHYDSSEYPRIVIMDPWREVLALTAGYRHTDELLATLQAVPSDYNGVRNWRDAIEKDRNNPLGLHRVGALYQNSTAFGIANRYYREALKCDGAKADNGLREELMFEIATNEVRLADWKAGRNALEQFRIDFPDSSRQDQILLGLVLTDVKQGKLSEGARHLDELKGRFPNSKATPVAADILARAKTQRRP